MAAQRFTLYDFLVDAVPGAIALLILITLLPARYNVFNAVSQAGLLSGAIFLILSYVLGHLTQAIASPIDEWFIQKEPRLAKEAGLPRPFEYQLDQAKQDGGTTVRKEVESNLGEFFDPDLTAYDLFFTTQSYLWNNDIGRMRRFQRLYTFFRGLYPLLFIGGLLHWAALILSLGDYYRSIWSASELGFIGLFLIMLAGIAYWRRVRFHKEMAKAMIYDFYTNVLQRKT